MRIIALCVCVLAAAEAGAQTVSQRGFVEGRVFGFPQTAPNDPKHVIGDVLVREEVFLKPVEWLQLAAGLDLRANSHEQVEDQWRLDYDDRGSRRPRAAIRRATATFTARHLSLDIGKQFIRWARADVLNPTDRFAPRDYLNVIDAEFLPVTGARATLQLGTETVDAVVVPRLTPSRMPLLDQRWTVVPPGFENVRLEDAGSDIPRGTQTGVRWSHAGDRFEMALSFFDGFNHLPTIETQLGASPDVVGIRRVYPQLRSYGADMAIPTGVVTLKGEAAYFTSPTSTSEEYVLYVIEVERQVGEWSLVCGYAGDVVTSSQLSFPFAPDRGIAKSILGRASYTVDPRRTVAIEGAARQNGDGVYLKGEYSQSFAQHWRLTMTVVGLTGNPADFLGQYRRNSHASLGLRLSF
jgi:hypothetical protein